MLPPPDPPWYRQPWPWLLMLLPGVAVVASLLTLYIAFDNPPSLVRDNWYKDGLAINRQLAQRDYARAHAISATLQFDPTAGHLEIRLSAADQPASLQLALIHPAEATLDLGIELRARGDGRYAAELPAGIEGRRYLQLEEAGGASAWRLAGTLESPPSTLTPLRPDPR